MPGLRDDAAVELVSVFDILTTAAKSGYGYLTESEDGSDVRRGLGVQNFNLSENPLQVPFADGPYLQTAIICERVLVEQDGVKSAIRMIDRITANAVGPSVPSVMKPITREMDLLLRFKSGSARGAYPIQIRIQKPSGESPEPMQQTVNFEGESDRGVDLIAQLTVQFETPGLYWFDIYLQDIRITRVPMRIIYLPQPTQSG